MSAGMTAQQIISRAAYEVGDDFLRNIPPDEQLRMLRRVLREVCIKTKILRDTVTFTTTNSKMYQLTGTDELGNNIGDNFIGFFRAEYNGKKMYEVILDQLMQTTYSADPNADDITGTTLQIAGPDDPIVYYIQYIQNNQWMRFAHTPNVGDTVRLWYYIVPRIDGTSGLAGLQDIPLIDYKYHDDLVLGLTVPIYRRAYRQALATKERRDYAKLLKEEYIEAKAEWKVKLDEILIEVMGYKDDTIPTIMDIATPFEQYDDDTNFETDETAI